MYGGVLSNGSRVLLHEIKVHGGQSVRRQRPVAASRRILELGTGPRKPRRLRTHGRCPVHIFGGLGRGPLRVSLRLLLRKGTPRPIVSKVRVVREVLSS